MDIISYFATNFAKILILTLYYIIYINIWLKISKLYSLHWLPRLWKRVVLEQINPHQGIVLQPDQRSLVYAWFISLCLYAVAELTSVMLFTHSYIFECSKIFWLVNLLHIKSRIFLSIRFPSELWATFKEIKLSLLKLSIVIKFKLCLYT